VALKRIILTGIIGAVTILGAALPTSAKASPAAASPWSAPLLLRANSGGGCALSRPARLDPVLSDPCPATPDWEYRFLTGDGSTLFSKVEFVNTSKTLALGFSGGKFKMETPNDNSTYLILDGILLDGTWAFEDSSGTYQMAPNGKGLPLKALTGGPTGYGWAACISICP
jgi:hypothetical protein